MLRLFIAIIVSFVVLMAQVLIVPYKTPLDNLLGHLSAVMLSLVFISTYALQTEETDEQAILAVTIIATFVILIVTVITFVQSVRKAMKEEARRKHLPTTTWLMDDGQRYACFLSHYKEEAGAESECKSHHRHRRLCL